MKSAHRHELQTNALAQRLEVAVERLRPHISKIAGAILVVAIGLLIWSYISKTSASKQGDAWSVYNEAIGINPPNLEDLHRSAQEYPGTKMQELANVAWADGQVFNAAQNYLYNRRMADDALQRATDTYQAILQTSDDERLVNRAHLGMARVYEMRSELDKARDEYLKVGGGYQEFAKQQAERLGKPEAKETYDWLAKAEPPRMMMPTGPGTPGQRPGFSEGDLTMPSEGPNTISPDVTSEPGPSFDELLKGLKELPSETGNRYEGDAQTPPLTGPPLPEDTATTSDTTPATEGSAPPADGAPATTDESTEGTEPGEPESAAAEGTETPPDEDKTEDNSAE